MQIATSCVATVVLVAVTVFTSLFLESSAAPNVGYVVESNIKTSEAALDVLSDSVKKMLAGCTTEAERKSHAPVVAFVEYFVPFVHGIHEDLRKDVKLNDPENRKKTIIELMVAIEDTQADLAYLMKTQGENTRMQDVLDDTVRKIIMNNGFEVAIVMTKSLPTRPGYSRAHKNLE